MTFDVSKIRADFPILATANVHGQPLAFHGLVYGIEDGLLRSLGLELSVPDDARAQVASAIAAIHQRDGGMLAAGL